MVIIIKSNSWLTLLGTSTSNENVIKKAYKWIIILNNSQQPFTAWKWENEESFKVGDWTGWQQSLSRKCKASQEKKNSPEKRQYYEHCRTVDRRTLILLRTNANLHTVSCWTGSKFTTGFVNLPGTPLSLVGLNVSE